MANIAIFRINYKSDFILTLNSDAGWTTPFCIKFWTGAPSQAYFVGWDGKEYINCKVDETDASKLIVLFDDHQLSVGQLKMQMAWHTTIADFPHARFDEVMNQMDVVATVEGEEKHVELAFEGETDPEVEYFLPAYANEAQRIANEEQRIANEQQRISNEQQRITNEESRIAAETIRQQNEQQRINQETARVNEFATLKSQSQAATRDANDAATLANQKAQLAADKAALAEAAATLANEKAQLAADKAALADAAATLANDKAALAQQKAEYAQQQGGYAKDQGDYAKNQGDYAKEQGDTALADHQRAESDHGIAADDHTQAGNDHTRAESDHGIAVDDHTQAGNDHTRAESDHGIAVDDHTQAGNDHTRAEADHGIAADDHTQAGNDHTRAESDHTRAESDHAAVEPFVDSLGAFDISAYHATGGVLAKYADLTAALGTNGANIPEALRKGGMSVKYAQSSDNKYVQYRYMGTDTTGNPNPFLDTTNWQGVDDEPTAGSENLVKSGGVYPCAEALDIQDFTKDVTNCEIYKDGYYIGNGSGSVLGGEIAYSGRAIARSLGWQKGQQIIINRINTAGSSSCAVATYKNGVFIANLISGNGGFLPDVPYTFTPSYDFDEIRFSLNSVSALSTLSVSKITLGSKRIRDIEVRLDEVENDVEEFNVKIDVVNNNLNYIGNNITGSEIYTPSSPTGVDNVVGSFNAWFGFSNYEDLPQNGFLKGITFSGTLSNDKTFDARISKKVKSGTTITGLTTIKTFSFVLPANTSSVTFTSMMPFEKDCVLELYIGSLQSGLINYVANPSASEFVRYKNQAVESGSLWNFKAVFAPFDNEDISDIENRLDEVEDRLDEGSKKKIKILAIGNSHTEDSFAYVPFIVKECFKSVDLTFGILYYGGCSLQQHEQHFDTPNDTSYAYRKILPTSNSWTTKSAGTSIQSAIADEDWDIIVLQQNSANEADYSTFQPYLNSLIRKIQSVITKPVRFAWLFPYANSTNLSSSVTMFEQFATNVQRVMDETTVSILFPAAAGMQNARTTSLQSLGGGGNMLYTDVHAQEGIPCYCLALPCALVIADLCGLAYEGIYGDPNIPTASWVTSHAIPNQNGASVGATADNCKIAQLCAIMAHKHPLQITDMVELGIVENI